MRSPTDQAAIHLVMAELVQRCECFAQGDAPVILHSTEPNAPAVAVSGCRIRVKGYRALDLPEGILAAPQWRVTGSDGQVFPTDLPERDFVAIVRIEKGEGITSSVVHIAPTPFVVDQLNRYGEDVDAGAYRRLSVSLTVVPNTGFLTEWDEYRNRWELLGLSADPASPYYRPTRAHMPSATSGDRDSGCEPASSANSRAVPTVAISGSSSPI